MNSQNFFLVAIVICGAVSGFFLVGNMTNSASTEPVDGWQRKSQLETPKLMADLQSAPNRFRNWPPQVGKQFPNVKFFDHTGERFSFSQLPARPTVIELIAMSCAGCQAFAGGNEVGAYGGFASQDDLKSLEHYFRRYTGQDLHAANVNVVQIVFYDLELQSPSPEELASWRKHFRLDRHRNTHVISGGDPLASSVSFNMIPGFLLLDADQTVQFDSCGHQPRHNLYTELLPAVKKMLKE